jgi:exodeoxyribonuclease VII large subunit
MSSEAPATAGQQSVLSVADLSALIKETLETQFPSVWVAGEISNLARPQSGHVYLTLKDEKAQVRAVLWRGTAQRVRFDLADGQQVVCCGNIDVYPPRGSYQLVIRQIEPLGEGALQLALRQLRERLAAEGLFADEHKKALPRFPRRIAFVTSPTGAAIRDFLEVLRRRWRGVDVLVIPARVQGAGAAGEIAAGIRAANRLTLRPDVLVVGRGGGSLEDLWCFNEEEVVRAIFASDIPVVSAVGHEIDVTLSDLVADVRALTPSEAGELIVPSGQELLASLDAHQDRLSASIRNLVASARMRLDALAHRRVLRQPFEAIHDRGQRLDELQLRAERAIQLKHDRSAERLHALAGRLEALSPLAVLSRGYSVTLRTNDGELVRDASRLEVGERITTRLANGSVVSRVEEIDEE